MVVSPTIGDGFFIHIQIAMRAKRLQEGKSLRALGQWIGVSFSSLARIERGEGKPNLTTRIAIMDWLGWDTSDEKAQCADASRTSIRTLAARVEVLERLVETLVSLPHNRRLFLP